MATKSVEKELLDLENQYWQALKERDHEAALRMTDDPAIITGSQGVARVDKRTLAAMLDAAPYALDAFELKDTEVEMVRDDLAIVAYKVHERLVVDGKRVTLDAADASLWIRRNGHWVCALHTEAILGDPFGRDRRATK